MGYSGAKRSERKSGFSAQRVGMAEITEDGIVVKTCSGRPVGVAKTRKVACQMIHEFHRSNPMYMGYDAELG